MNDAVIWALMCILLLVLGGCTTPRPEPIEFLTATALLATATAAPTSNATVSATSTPAASATPAPAAEETLASDLADVVSVEVTGDPGAYRFQVGVLSPDTGCDQYADWWEVVSEDGELIYRRVLLHSHVGEQPFERSGGPVPIEAGAVVYVRAHMHPGGYGGAAFKGSAQAGFQPVELPADFAAALAEKEPLPQDCAF